MPPRAIICELCGGQFFKASLAHHQKVCRERVGVQVYDCPYCNCGVPMLQMDSHIMRCPEARAAGGRPTGASSTLASRLERDKRRMESGTPLGDGSTPVGGHGGDAPEEFAPEEDARIACQGCGRRFAIERVGKHQAICTRLKSKPRREFQVQRRYCEGGSTGRTVAIGGSSSSSGMRGGSSTPAPLNSNWRRKSAELQAAMRAGREFPMPRWGEENVLTHGRGPSPPPSRASASLRSTGEGWRPRGGGWSPKASQKDEGWSPNASLRSTGRGLAAMERMSSPPPGGRRTSPSRRAPASPKQRVHAPRGGSLHAARPMTTGDLLVMNGRNLSYDFGEEDPSPAAALKSQFSKMDMDGDGTLSFVELSCLLRAGNPRMSDRAVRILFDSIDQDSNNCVDFGEFVDYVHQVDYIHNARAAAAGGPRQGRAGTSVGRSRAAPSHPSSLPGCAGSAVKYGTRRREPTSPGASRERAHGLPVSKPEMVF